MQLKLPKGQKRYIKNRHMLHGTNVIFVFINASVCIKKKNFKYLNVFKD